MADNVHCAQYASGDTACIRYGPQLEANVAGAIHQRCGRLDPDQAPDEEQHSVHVEVWLLMISADQPGLCCSSLAWII